MLTYTMSHARFINNVTFNTHSKSTVYMFDCAIINNVRYMHYPCLLNTHVTTNNILYANKKCWAHACTPNIMHIHAISKYRSIHTTRRYWFGAQHYTRLLQNT